MSKTVSRVKTKSSKLAITEPSKAESSKISETIRTNKGLSQKNFIEEANRIMRERMKNKGSSINSKARLKTVILNDTKEISLKNYLIDLLKCKRTEINEKERNITKALKDCELGLDSDATEFNGFVERTKQKQKAEDLKCANLKKEHIDIEKEIIELDKKLKQNQEDMEKCIRNIYKFKACGAFIHRVYGQKFPFEIITEEKELKDDNISKACESVLENYKKISKEQSGLEFDDEIMVSKFTEFEELIIKSLDEKEKEHKKAIKTDEENKKTINELELKEQECDKEYQLLIQEKINLENQIAKAKTQRLADYKQTLKHIASLRAEIISDMNPKEIKEATKDKTEMGQAKDAIFVLQNQEREVNDFINTLKQLEIEDSFSFNYYAKKRNEEIKKIKQAKYNEEEKKKTALKNLRAEKRAEKVVIRGRKVPKDYRSELIKEKNKKIKKVDNDDQTDLDMLYYEDD
ncbi:MAG: hypothetical protein MJ252_06405 [archaeon]|nr:hypothetical protein [archaeon]